MTEIARLHRPLPHRLKSRRGRNGRGVQSGRLTPRGELWRSRSFAECDADFSRRRRVIGKRRARRAQVSHPNACRIYDVAEEQDRLVLVMEFIEGESPGATCRARSVARAGSSTDRAGNTIGARSIPQNWNRAPRPETREHYSVRRGERSCSILALPST